MRYKEEPIKNINGEQCGTKVTEIPDEEPVKEESTDEEKETKKKDKEERY